MISKSYRLLNYLNRSHGRFTRLLVGQLAWVGSWLASRDPALANWAKQCFLRDDFKQGVRFCAWLARVSWPFLHVWEDRFFDFTQGAKGDLLVAMQQFLEKHRGRQPELVFLSDQLFVLAAEVHDTIETYQGDPEAVSAVMHRYKVMADHLLKAIETTQKQARPAKTSRRKGDFVQADAEKALRDFATLLPKEQWPWYLVSGTFLGLYRDGGFMAHDYDIDVGINADKVDHEALLQQLKSQQLFVVKKVDYHLEVAQNSSGYYALHSYPSLYKLVHETGINVDVFIHYREGAVLWHGSVIHRWDNQAFGLAEYELAGITVLGPDNPETYLTENYGDWRTPITNFDCTTGTPNLVVARNYLSVALFLKRLGHYVGRDAVQYQQLRRALLSSRVLKEQNEHLHFVNFFSL